MVLTEPKIMTWKSQLQHHEVPERFDMSRKTTQLKKKQKMQRVFDPRRVRDPRKVDGRQSLTDHLAERRRGVQVGIVSRLADLVDPHQESAVMKNLVAHVEMYTENQRAADLRVDVTEVQVETRLMLSPAAVVGRQGTEINQVIVIEAKKTVLSIRPRTVGQVKMTKFMMTMKCLYPMMTWRSQVRPGTFPTTGSEAFGEQNPQEKLICLEGVHLDRKLLSRMPAGKFADPTQRAMSSRTKIPNLPVLCREEKFVVPDPAKTAPNMMMSRQWVQGRTDQFLDGAPKSLMPKQISRLPKKVPPREISSKRHVVLRKRGEGRFNDRDQKMALKHFLRMCSLLGHHRTQDVPSREGAPKSTLTAPVKRRELAITTVLAVVPLQLGAVLVVPDHRMAVLSLLVRRQLVWSVGEGVANFCNKWVTPWEIPNILDLFGAYLVINPWIQE
jgi:hypothetical protein